MPATVQDLSVWSQFGLPGIVIGALFLTVWGMALFIFVKQLQMQKEERGEWRQTIDAMMSRTEANQKETNEILRDLARVIQNANERYRQFDGRQ